MGRRMHRRGLVSGGDGNLSVRLTGGRLLTTPSGRNKGYLEASSLVLVRVRDGRPLGPGRPSSELAMHLAIYQERPAVGAVVHAHPPTAVAFSLAGVSLARCLLPEAVFSLGPIAQVGYTTPTTDQVAEAIRGPAASHDVLLLERHGSVTLGATLEQAYDRLEALEHTARITHLARSLGPLSELPAEEVARLRALGSAGGSPGGCQGCTACPAGRTPAPPGEVEEITRAVLERLAGG